jgi:hypothetical protein
MDILQYQGKNYISRTTASRILKVGMQTVNYHIKKGKLEMVKMDDIKIVTLDSVLKLNDYLFFRSHKNKL